MTHSIVTKLFHNLRALLLSPLNPDLPLKIQIDLFESGDRDRM
ncbi:hypothetical protein [Chamaesiphon minutus]|nr:hypothetical protein [Chamaesiphon minutus]